MTREEYKAKKQALVEEIERAFDGVQCEEGTTIYEANAIDNYASDEELAYVRSCATKTRWQDMPDKDIQNCPTIMYLDAKGLRHYFPAYLVWYLRHIDYEEEDAFIATLHSVIFALGVCFRADRTDIEGLGKRFNLFSTEQKRVIAHFLQFKHEQLDYREERWNLTPDPEDDNESWLECDHADIQRALDDYWGQFL